MGDVANDPLILLVDGERAVPEFTDPLEDFGDAIIDQRWTSHVQVSTRCNLVALVWLHHSPSSFSKRGIHWRALRPILRWIYLERIIDANVAAQILILPQDFLPLGLVLVCQ